LLTTLYDQNAAGPTGHSATKELLFMDWIYEWVQEQLPFLTSISTGNFLCDHALETGCEICDAPVWYSPTGKE
jgi:hypothetical protein